MLEALGIGALALAVLSVLFLVALVARRMSLPARSDDGSSSRRGSFRWRSRWSTATRSRRPS